MIPIHLHDWEKVKGMLERRAHISSAYAGLKTRCTDYQDSIETQTFGELRMTPLEIRQEVLDLAKQYTSKDRNSSYGEPEDNFKNIGRLWDDYLVAKNGGMAADITPVDVSIMNILLKVARLATNPTHKDSWIDICGYAACGAGVALRDS